MVNFLTFVGISIILVLIILAATYFINIPTNDYEKHSAYECGFEPFGDARSFFDIHFYTIGLLFIIFDLEVVFLIPAVVDIANISLFGYINLVIFLLVVLVGFYYEWSIGLLNWVPEKAQFNIKNVIQFSPVSLFIDTNINLFSYVNWVFILFWFLIVVSLFLNQLSNLVYRVINLAGLSLLVVAMWTYFTDFTFLYIVYILAFVGAVVMLFLSVILMLPASVTTANVVYMAVSPFLLATEISSIQTIDDGVINFAFYWCLVGLLYAIYYLSPVSLNELVLYRANIKAVINRELLWLYNNIMTAKSLHAKLKFFKLTLCKYWRIIQSFFGFNTPTSVLSAYTKNPLNYAVMPSPVVLGLFWHDCLYFIYVNLESKLYQEDVAIMYNNTQPVWGNTFMIFEFGYAPSRSIAFREFPIRDLNRPYIPATLKYSLFNLLKSDNDDIFYIKYLPGNSASVLWLNRVIFALDLVIFFVFTIMQHVTIRLKAIICDNIELIKQAVVVISAFSAVVPLSGSSAGKNWEKLAAGVIEGTSSDSLLAIKQILYEENSLFLLISVVGLLVALIGSAVFTKHSK